MGPRRRCKPVRTRRSAAHVGVPDPERARPANEPCETRILGRPAGAWRSDSTAAAQRARVAAGRSEVGSAAARDAGQAQGESELRGVSCAFRFVRAGVRGLRARRRDADPKTWRDGRSIRRLFSRAVGKVPDSRVCKIISASIGRRTSSIILAVNCSPTALGRSLLLSDEPAIERMKTTLAANGYRFDSLVETIVTSFPVPEQTKHRPRRKLNRKVIRMRNRIKAIFKFHLPPDRSSRRRSHHGSALARVAAVLCGGNHLGQLSRSDSASSSWGTASTRITGAPRARAPR